MQKKVACFEENEAYVDSAEDEEHSVLYEMCVQNDYGALPDIDQTVA